MLTVNNKNTRKRRETCSKLMIKTPERPQWHHSSIFIANFKHISHVFPRFAHISTSQLANFSANWSVKLANFSAQYGTPSKVMLRYFCKTSEHFFWKATQCPYKLSPIKRNIDKHSFIQDHHTLVCFNLFSDFVYSY